MSLDINDYEYNIETDYKSSRTHVMFQWQTDPPTEPGHYRAINRLGRGAWVDVRKIKDHIYVDYGDGNAVELFNFDYWLGPLPEPEPPK